MLREGWRWWKSLLEQRRMAEGSDAAAGFLVALASAPFSTAAVAVPSHRKLPPVLEQIEERPVVLRRSREGRRLSRFRYNNAEGFFRSSRIQDGRLRGDTLYSLGIVTQLGLSAHLLDVGFDDRWCAQYIGLHVARFLAYANATGFDLHSADFELLAGNSLSIQQLAPSECPECPTRLPIRAPRSPRSGA